MCNSKCYDTISIIVSLVLGVIFAILVFCFPSLFFLGILFGFLLSIAALFLLTITASSLLRQDKRLNDCICATGKRLLIPALLLLAAAMIAFIFLTLCIATFITYPILTFILYTLITYTFFSLYCFLACLIEAGCHHCGCEDYCTLDKVCIGTHEADPTVDQCTDCLSFVKK